MMVMLMVHVRVVAGGGAGAHLPLPPADHLKHGAQADKGLVEVSCLSPLWLSNHVFTVLLRFVCGCSYYLCSADA